MKRLLICLAALASAIAATTVNAQTKTPLPPSVAATEVPRNMKQAYRDYCRGKRPETSLQNDAAVRFTFTGRDRETDVVAQCSDALKAAFTLPVNDVKLALTMLSFRPFEPLWPVMEKSWGSDLGRLRAKLKELAYDASDTELGLTMEGFVNRDLARAYALRQLGYDEEALQILERARAEVDRKAQKYSDGLEFERTMLATFLAGMVSAREGSMAGAKVLENFIASFPMESEYRLNPLTNFAAYLAEGGDHARSLAIIEPAYEQFRGRPISDTSYDLGGADREFAWIIACNRWHLGGPEDAQPFIDRISEAPERPRDEYFAKIKRSTIINLRMYRCIGHEQNWFAQFSGEDLPLFDKTWLLLQPNYDDIDGPLAGWTVPEEVSRQFDRYYRVLPDSYSLALRLWRREPSPS